MALLKYGPLLQFLMPLILSHASVNMTKLLLLRVVAFSQEALAAVGLGMTLFSWLTIPVSTDLQAVTLVMVRSRRDKRRALALTLVTCGVMSVIFAVLCLTPLGDIIIEAIFHLTDDTRRKLQVYLLTMVPNVWLQAVAFFHFGILLHQRLSIYVTVASLMELALQVLTVCVLKLTHIELIYIPVISIFVGSVGKLVVAMVTYILHAQCRLPEERAQFGNTALGADIRIMDLVKFSAPLVLVGILRGKGDPYGQWVVALHARRVAAFSDKETAVFSMIKFLYMAIYYWLFNLQYLAPAFHTSRHSVVCSNTEQPQSAQQVADSDHCGESSGTDKPQPVYKTKRSQSLPANRRAARLSHGQQANHRARSHSVPSNQLIYHYLPATETLVPYVAANESLDLHRHLSNDEQGRDDAESKAVTVGYSLTQILLFSTIVTAVSAALSYPIFLIPQASYFLFSTLLGESQDLVKSSQAALIWVLPMPVTIACVSLILGVFLEAKRTHLMLPGYLLGLGLRFVALALPSTLPSAQVGLASVVLDYGGRAIGLVICYCVVAKSTSQNQPQNVADVNERTRLKTDQSAATKNFRTGGST